MAGSLSPRIAASTRLQLRRQKQDNPQGNPLKTDPPLNSAAQGRSSELRALTVSDSLPSQGCQALYSFNFSYFRRSSGS